MSDDQLRELYQTFIAKGKTQLESRQFVKLLKQAKVIDASYTTTTADLDFAKAKAGSKTAGITFEQFKESISIIAKRKGVAVEALSQVLVSTEGPTYTGTKTDAVRFYDDKSTYTGVHRFGGPTIVDNRPDRYVSSGGAGPAVDLAQLLDRSTPDVRGRNVPKK